MTGAVTTSSSQRPGLIRQQIVDIIPEKTCAYLSTSCVPGIPVAAQVFFGSNRETARKSRTARSLNPRASGLKKSSEKHRLLCDLGSDRLGMLTNSIFTPGHKLLKRGQPPRQRSCLAIPSIVAIRTTCVSLFLLRTKASSRRPGMAIHLLDMFRKKAGFAPHGERPSCCDQTISTASRNSRRPHPPADCGMVQPQSFGGRMDAAMPGNLKEHFQIVPFRCVRIYRRGPLLEQSAGSLQQMSTGRRAPTR